MKDKIKKILLKYWGYPSFRSLQEDIILSVLNGKDTLALMPTGGGKSITFQVPTMAKEGLCIVVTPLIALMKDQVANLQKHGIKAISLDSSMSYREIDIALDKCIFSDIKFLYLSPERLGTDLFKAKLPAMNINLIAIDEAHCISQWGYDFRPSYLKIAEIREFAKDVPILALTASATPEVAKDIMDKLEFKKHNVFRKSFERKNLIYIVRKTEKKLQYLLRIIKYVPGTGIIYVRNRKQTVEVAKFLNHRGIKAGFYHAGLKPDQRSLIQEQWISGDTRVIVSTNAFGMGIDKPNVRFVIHIDIPDSLEAYYQEAGRGGRDEKKAFAVLLYDDNDIINLRQRVSKEFPEVKYIKIVYNALSNFLNIPNGFGKGTTYPFVFTDFIKKYNLKAIETFSSLKILQQEGLIYLSEAFYNPSKMRFIVDNDDLYKFQVANPNYDKIIKLMLRTYSGMFTDYVRIDENYIARFFKVNKKLIIKYLNKLHELKLADYLQENSSPKITFIEERLPEDSIGISYENYGFRKKRFIERIDSVIKYSDSIAKCRSQIILEYFGEENANRCGTCDICRRRNELKLSKYEFDIVLKELKEIITKEKKTLNDIIDLSKFPHHKTIKVIQWLFDNNKIKYDTEMRLIWEK